MEKNIKKRVYISVTESIGCPVEIDTLEINYTSIKKRVEASWRDSDLVSVDLGPSLFY